MKSVYLGKNLLVIFTEISHLTAVPMPKNSQKSFLKKAIHTVDGGNVLISISPIMYDLRFL